MMVVQHCSEVGGIPPRLWEPSAMGNDDHIPSGTPERRLDPRDALTGWERPAFACGCGRGCRSWKDHHANVARVDSDADAVVGTLLTEDLRAAGAR
jgi:hypothetical protein